VRGATALLTSADLGFTRSTLEMMLSYAGTYLDSPSTTSSTTYTLEFRSTVATKTVRVQENGSISSIVLLEIGA
jgi:hypothetical protein